MKCLSYEDRELIRRATRDGRVARVNEGKEKRGLRKRAERGLRKENDNMKRRA